MASTGTTSVEIEQEVLVCPNCGNKIILYVTYDMVIHALHLNELGVEKEVEASAKLKVTGARVLAHDCRKPVTRTILEDVFGVRAAEQSAIRSVADVSD